METNFLIGSMCFLPTVIASITQAEQVNCILLSKGHRNCVVHVGSVLSKTHISTFDKIWVLIRNTEG